MQDHKAVGEGDTGPNTGGMGAYSPAPVVTAAIEAQVNFLWQRCQSLQCPCTSHLQRRTRDGRELTCKK